MSNLVALVDCNSFYCSCERVFKPNLRDKPVVVLSNNDGCVVARTDEVKALGIPMGEPYFKVKDLLAAKGVTAFSSNYALYGDMSRRVMQTLSEYTPEMEIYSIDEAFLSFDGFNHIDLTKYSLDIRSTVKQNTGIPVSIGIGSTKVLAKAANYYAKKNKQLTNGVVNLQDYNNIDHFLEKIPVGDIWGIGWRSAEKLERINIKTACALKHANERVIQKILSITGRRIVEELRGNSCISLDLIANDKKQIVSSRSFGKPIMKIEDLKESIANHVTTAAEKLRKQDCIAKSILVFIHTSPFKYVPQYYNSSSKNHLSGTSATNKLINLAFSSLEEIYKPGYEYKKAGIILMDINKKSTSQLDFFDSNDNLKDDQIMKTIDKINQCYGRGSVKHAACGVNRFWKMLSEMKSPNYSTRWSDLPKI